VYITVRVVIRRRLRRTLVWWCWGLSNRVLLQERCQTGEQSGFIGVSESHLNLASFQHDMAVHASWRFSVGGHLGCFRGSWLGLYDGLWDPSSPPIQSARSQLSSGIY
jgi:hypothetical protein